MFGKEGIKLTFSDDIMVYQENSKQSRQTVKNKVKQSGYSTRYQQQQK